MFNEKANITHITQRKVVLLRKGLSMRSLAKKVGCCAAAVCFAINKCQQSRSLHEKIAGELGVTLQEFWPELYGDKCEE